VLQGWLVSGNPIRTMPGYKAVCAWLVINVVISEELHENHIENKQHIHRCKVLFEFESLNNNDLIIAFASSITLAIQEMQLKLNLGYEQLNTCTANLHYEIWIVSSLITRQCHCMCLIPATSTNYIMHASKAKFPELLSFSLKLQVVQKFNSAHIMDLKYRLSTPVLYYTSLCFVHHRSVVMVNIISFYCINGCSGKGTIYFCLQSI